MRCCGVALFLSLSLLVASAAPSAKPTALSLVSPALAWGTKQFFGKAGLAQVSYETLPFSYAWRELLTGVLSRDQRPGLVVVFAGQQLETWELGQLGSSPLLQPLHSAVMKAPSSLAMVNLLKERQPTAGIRDAVSEVVQSAGADLKVVGACSPSEGVGDTDAAFRNALQGLSTDKPAVVLVCASGSLSEEMSELQSILASLDAHNGDHAVVFISDAAPQEVLTAGHGRSLLQEAPVLDVCDDLCQTHVKFVEGAILLLVLVFAATIGLCCLSILDTPTRFEKRQDTE